MHTRDTDNQTDRRIENPQVTEVVYDGVVGNWMALSFLKLPTPVPVGESYTSYARLNVESIPNNHVFGLSILSLSDIYKYAVNRPS